MKGNKRKYRDNRKKRMKESNKSYRGRRNSKNNRNRRNFKGNNRRFKGRRKSRRNLRDRFRRNRRDNNSKCYNNNNLLDRWIRCRDRRVRWKIVRFSGPITNSLRCSLFSLNLFSSSSRRRWTFSRIVMG